MAKIFFVLSLMLICLFSCKNEKTKESLISDKNSQIKVFSKEVIELDNQATLLIHGRNKENCLEALALVQKAIQLDSAFFYAYITKAHIYTILGDYEQAINVNKLIVNEVKNHDIEVYSSLAKLYEKIGESDTAREYYLKAVEFYSYLYDKRGELFLLVYKAHFNFILNQEKGLKDIDSLIEKYPESEDLKLFKKHLFLEYNHQVTLDNL